jgi:hypothetical protein
MVSTRGFEKEELGTNVENGFRSGSYYTLDKYLWVDSLNRLVKDDTIPNYCTIPMALTSRCTAIIKSKSWKTL